MGLGDVPERYRPPALRSRLISVQLRTTSRGGLGRPLAEDVGVAADQLLAAVLGHRREVALTPLLEQQGEEVDLEQHVAELVEQLGVVDRVGGVGQLVGLLDRVRHDRALVLLAVPGALDPQPARDLVEPQERGREILAGRH